MWGWSVMKDWWREKERVAWGMRGKERFQQNSSLHTSLWSWRDIDQSLALREEDLINLWGGKREKKSMEKERRKRKLMPKPRERNTNGKWDILAPTCLNIPFSWNYQFALASSVFKSNTDTLSVLCWHVIKYFPLTYFSMNLIPLTRLTGNIPILTGGILQYALAQ